MTTRFKVGDHVSWNSEAGRVSGRIVKVHTRDVRYKGYTHHASRDDPQYAIKSDTSEHIAMHKGSALRRRRGCCVYEAAGCEADDACTGGDGRTQSHGRQP